MKLKALIFDVDGTLAETEEAHRAAFNSTFKSSGLDWNWSVSDYRQLLKTTGGKERMRAFQAGFSAGERRLSDDEIAEFHAEKTKAYGDVLASGQLELRPGVADLIAAAKQAGLKVTVATTTNTPNVEALCQCCWGKPALEVFDHVSAGDMVAHKKPAPDVFLLSLQQLDLPAKNCIAFEDSRNGVLSALGADLRVLVTPSAYTDSDDFSDADWVTPTLERENLPDVITKHL
jgi:HAD superfamily hydrolase (TIGR01509 family)